MKGLPIEISTVRHYRGQSNWTGHGCAHFFISDDGLPIANWENDFVVGLFQCGRERAGTMKD